MFLSLNKLLVAGMEDMWRPGDVGRAGPDHGDPKAHTNQHHLHPESDGKSLRYFKQGTDAQICVESGWKRDSGVRWRR